MPNHKLIVSGAFANAAAPLVPLVPGLYKLGTDASEELYGSNSNDTLFGLGGRDTAYGHDGSDSIYGGLGGDSLYGGAGQDAIYGGGGKDLIAGGFDDDQLYGDAQADRLFGEEGNDRLWGGDGDDILNGGLGADMLFGGAGGDLFRFINLVEVGLDPATRDSIADFEFGIDKIDLGAIDADAIHNGNNVFRLSQTGMHDGLPGSLRVVTADGDTFVMGDRNGDGASDFAIQLEGIYQLTASDFYL